MIVVDRSADPMFNPVVRRITSLEDTMRSISSNTNDGRSLKRWIAERSTTLFLLLALFATTVRAEDATGFIHAKQIDGVWWFINADGEKFVSIGVNHIEPHLWLAPYNKAATLKKYGSDMVGKDSHFNTSGNAAKKWIETQVKTTRELGFNTFDVLRDINPKAATLHEAAHGLSRKR
jgi:hypothetical protein